MDIMARTVIAVGKPPTVNNVQAFDVAIRAVCPEIDGVSTDGVTIWFQPSATAGQIVAATAAASSYVDPIGTVVISQPAAAPPLPPRSWP